VKKCEIRFGAAYEAPKLHPDTAKNTYSNLITFTGDNRLTAAAGNNIITNAITAVAELSIAHDENGNSTGTKLR
jgi:hypothetical protein